MEIGKWK
jgi:hypothetical protein